MQDARRKEPQNYFRGADIHGVAGIVSALIARDDGEVRRQEVYDLALALISPLRPDYSDVHGRHILHCLAEQDGITKRTSCQLSRDAELGACQTKSFLFSRLTTQARGLNLLSFVSANPRCLTCARTRITQRRPDPHSNGAFSPRSMRAHRAFRSCSATSAPAARSCSIGVRERLGRHAVPVHRSRARGDDTRAFLSGDHQSVAVPRGGGDRAAPVRRARRLLMQPLRFSVRRGRAPAGSPSRFCSTSSWSCARSRVSRASSRAA